MKKVKMYKGYVIAVNKEGTQYQVFTKEEWSYGEGFRYPEFDDCASIKEAIENIMG